MGLIVEIDNVYVVISTIDDILPNREETILDNSFTKLCVANAPKLTGE
jgi:hypothetical protein